MIGSFAKRTERKSKMQSISALKARYAGLSAKLFPARGNLLVIEDNKPVTFYVLMNPDRDYSSKGVWVHPVGVHFVEKQQIVCSEVEEAGPCSVCERIRDMESQGFQEAQIFRIRGPKKYAMNVIVKGEEISRIFLATATVGEEIFRTWKAVWDEEGINIFDPLASTAWTVTRLKQDGKTRYEVDFEIKPAPIIIGDNAEERIARILKSALNLDERFKLPDVASGKAGDR
jgi:hypothetical protein